MARSRIPGCNSVVERTAQRQRSRAVKRQACLIELPQHACCVACSCYLLAGTSLLVRLGKKFEAVDGLCRSAYAWPLIAAAGAFWRQSPAV
jgi:hypothetical protein